jgi:hypothetical protein
MFLASALVIVVLAGVSVLSLVAVGRLVSANREIATRAIPVLSLTATAREAIPQLLGLEARAVALGDPRYATAWTKLAAQLAEDLESVTAYALSEREARHLHEARSAFEEYRRIVAEEHAFLRRRDRTRAGHLTDTAAVRDRAPRGAYVDRGTDLPGRGSWSGAIWNGHHCSADDPLPRSAVVSHGGGRRELVPRAHRDRQS